MQQIKLLALDCELLLHGRGVHQLLVDLVELKGFAIILNDDLCRAGRPDKVPEAVFNDRRPDRRGGLVALLPVTVTETVQIDGRAAWGAPIERVGSAAGHACARAERECPPLVLAVLVLEKRFRRKPSRTP